MRYIKLSLVIIWMTIIFLFSNQKGVESGKLSDGLILDFVRMIEKINHKTYSDEEILDKFVKPVRKAAHFTIYLILGVLVFVFVEDFNAKHLILLSLMVCFIYSISDEIHQCFVEGREGRIFDVFIDTLGSYVGILLMTRFRHIAHK